MTWGSSACEGVGCEAGVAGAGAVGAATVLSLIERGGMFRELVLLDRDPKRANGDPTDMRYATPLSPTVDIRAGDYDAVAGAELVTITAGVNEKTGGATDRSDPGGPAAAARHQRCGYADGCRSRRGGAGGGAHGRHRPARPAGRPHPPAGRSQPGVLHRQPIDSLRFRVHLAERLRVRPRDVQVMVVGEHGTSEVLLWSSAAVSGIPVVDLLRDGDQPLEELKEQIENDIRYANITIIEGTGASQYGIARRPRGWPRRCCGTRAPSFRSRPTRRPTT